MWALRTAGGDRINVFNNMLERSPWDNSGYRMWFEAMEQRPDRPLDEVIRSWLASASEVRYLEVYVSATAATPDARPDKTPRPEDIWQLYGWHWWNTLYSLSIEETIVFDTETTGVSSELDEAVSIAVRSFAAPKGAPVEFYTLIAPRFPEKLLERNADGKSAYDIHGIHPNDLVGKPTFPVIHGRLREILRGKNWVCWNADFDVTLVDSLCIRHGLPLIPRNRVVCAMKLLSPLAGKWDEGRAAYSWAKLEDMASAIGLEFPDAHDAAADVNMTISVMRWAYSQVQNRMGSC